MATSPQPAKAKQLAPAAQRPLLVVFVAVAAGMVLDRVLPIWPGVLPGIWLAVGCFAWLAWMVFIRRRREFTAALFLLLSAAALAAAWHHTGWNLFGEEEIGRFAHEEAAPVCLSGRVLAVPSQLPAPPFDPMRSGSGGDQTRVRLEVDGIRDRAAWRAASGRVDVWVSGHLLGLRAGDRVQVFGQLRAEPIVSNPGERDFAVAARHDRRLCGVRSEAPECISRVDAVSSFNPFAVPRWVADAMAEIRFRADRMLWRYLDHRRAGLAAAVLLGERDELRRDQFEPYVETSTVHLLVISGMHVAILSMVLFGALRLGWLPRRWGLVLIAGTTIFYAMLVQAEPSVVRATIVVVAFCWAQFIGRARDGFNILALAALIVLAIDPTDLFRVGPQLSFLAVGALVWYAQRPSRRRVIHPLDQLLAASDPWPMRAARHIGRWLGEGMLVGLVVGVVLAPLLMNQFHLFSPIGLVLNPFVGLPMSIALISGLGVMVFGWLLPPVAHFCGHVCDWSLSFVHTAVEWAARLPASHAWVPGPPGWWLAGFYLGLAAAALWPARMPRTRWCVAMLSGWIAIGFAGPLFRGGDDTFRCTFLSVGHGTATVLELPDGRTMLYDAGHQGPPETVAETVSGYLWSRGKSHLDAIVISHADTDHFNALPRLLDRFSVGVVYVSPVMLENHSRSVEALWQAIKEHGVPLRPLSAGDRLSTAAVQIEVLHPPSRGVVVADAAKLDNANSIVLKIAYAGRRVLLPGDLESTGLDETKAGRGKGIEEC
ncbi:MAG: ComEC/Rec2 family competence protein [Planctomycetia bacterium]|nr:ComEC/Rec2 family competence protein [Planctomycetia bacterium]